MKQALGLNKDRLRRLRELMAAHSWDAMLLYGHSWRKEFFRSLLNLNFQGPHAVIAVFRSNGIAALVSDPWDCELVSSHIDGTVSLAGNFSDGLKLLFSGRKHFATAIAGMEMMEEDFIETIRRSIGQNPESASFEVEELRRMKSPEEIDLLTKGCELADRGYQHFSEVIDIGMREYELVAEVESFLKANGAEDNFMLIASGGTEVVGMRPPTDRRFQLGDSVTTELSPQVGGYYAQICRTLVLGEPSANQRKSYEIFAEAQRAGQDRVKPGIDISDVARAENDVFRKYGYGDYTGSKYTRVRGHCLGLYLDENPHILEEVHYTVKEGMVLIVHPNTYLPLSGYMVFGDTLLVTSKGCISLNKTERKLFQKE